MHICECIECARMLRPSGQQVGAALVDWAARQRQGAEPPGLSPPTSAAAASHSAAPIRRKWEACMHCMKSCRKRHSCASMLLSRWKARRRAGAPPARWVLAPGRWVLGLAPEAQAEKKAKSASRRRRRPRKLCWTTPCWEGARQQLRGGAGAGRRARHCGRALAHAQGPPAPAVPCTCEMSQHSPPTWQTAPPAGRDRHAARLREGGRLGRLSGGSEWWHWAPLQLF